MQDTVAADLLERFSLSHASGSLEARFSHISHDSRTCRPDSLFVALPGSHTDGNRFISEAIHNGASVIVTSGAVHGCSDIPILLTDSPRTFLSQVSAWFYRSPSTDMKIIGITGTDGKTTACYAAYQLFNRLGMKTGILSTVYKDDGGGITLRKDRITTPEAPLVHRFIRNAADNGCEAVLIEASSHGLSYATSRLADVVFDAAVLTTLTSDHLEFHRTRGQYIEDKMNLFRQLKHADSPALLPDDLIISIPKGKRVTYPASAPNVSCPRFFRRNFNAVKTLAAVMFEKDHHQIERASAGITLPEGRWSVNRISSRECIIDYAHTPDAFKNVFSYIKETYPNKRVISLFGAAGERDVSSRPKMGQQAARGSDVVIITSDDPRNDDPDETYENICGTLSMSERKKFSLHPDRRRAIAHAASISRPGDVLLFLGKGHEKSQIIGDTAQPWDELEEITAAMRRV
jgi:UDP-N-acetylmuramoyl-L-alanyl-D-glutamate--2,6-diaminopimelate ligase